MPDLSQRRDDLASTSREWYGGPTQDTPSLQTLLQMFPYAVIIIDQLDGSEVIPVPSEQAALEYLRERSQYWVDPDNPDAPSVQERQMYTLEQLRGLYTANAADDTATIDIAPIRQNEFAQ